MKDKLKSMDFLRFLVMGALLLACVGMEYYFHVVRGITVVYTHLYYVPIIVAALWWGLKGGLYVGLFLGLIHTVSGLPGISGAVLSRSLALVFIGVVVGIIAERYKRAEKKLSRTQQDWRGIFQAIGQPVLILDPQHKILSVNPAAIKASGRSEEELLGGRCFEIFHGIGQPPKGCPLKKMLISGQPETAVMEVESLGGFFTISCTPVLDDSGRITRVIHTAADITERRRAEEALKESESFLQNVFDAIQDGISVLDRDLNIIQVNAWMERMYSDQMPLVGKKCYAVYQQRQSPCPWCPSIPAINTGEVHREIVPYPSAEKPAGWIELSAFPLKDADDKVVGIIEHVKDVTSRKQAESALQKSEEKYRTILESTEEIYVELDLAGNFTFFNDILCKVMGYSRNELIGVNNREYTTPETAEKMYQTFNKIYKTGKPTKVIDCEIFVKDGDKRIVEMSVFLMLDSGGKPTGFRCMGRDTTERRQAEEDRKKLEDQLQQAQKMEAIGTLAGGIAHDFNNMLQIVYGYIQILLRGKEPSDPDYIKLKAIEKSAQSAGDLTKQLLILGRKVESDLRPLLINQEIVRVSKLLERTIPKMIDIELHLAENLKIVNADPAQIEQIMVNLGINARDAMPDGGRLILETENVILDEEYCKAHLGTEPGEYVLVSVSDTGHGMDKETLERIFEPFFTLKETGEGTGLGLAMVYGIVKSHGGDITCYSEPSQGTTFKIYFPVIEQETREIEEKEGENPIKGGNETILLVDDEDGIREFGEEMLSGFGYTVIVASDGESALEIYHQKKEEIDLVILDLIMPGMGGRQCLQELRKIDPRVKIFIASGYTVTGKASELLESGAVGFIGKPYQITDMLKKVREILDKD